MKTLNIHSNIIGYLGLLVIVIVAAATIWYFIRKHLRRGQLLHNWTLITSTPKSYQEANNREGANTDKPAQTTTNKQPQQTPTVKLEYE